MAGWNALDLVGPSWQNGTWNMEHVPKGAVGREPYISAFVDFYTCCFEVALN